jgi:diaminopimelate decarboxylase
MRTPSVLLLTLVGISQSSAFAPTVTLRRRSLALSMANPERSVFLTPETAKACIDAAGGSPLYAYSLAKLEESAEACLGFPNAFGLTVRYAMKACPNASVLKFFSSKGIHIDASSGYEVSYQFV